MRRLSLDEQNRLHLPTIDYTPDTNCVMYSVNGKEVTNDSILRYQTGRNSGFISHGKVITKPLFTPSARVIGNYIHANIFKSDEFYNSSVLLDAETGEQVVTGFGAYFVDGPYFAFRVNGKLMSDHRWGIYSLNEHKLIRNPNIEYSNIHKIVDDLLSKNE